MRQDSPTDSRPSPQADPKRTRPSDPAAVVLGYLNFSSGAFDPTVWRAMNAVFESVESAPEQSATAAGPIVERPDAATRVAVLLAERLEALAVTEAAFRDATQARAVLDLLFSRLLPAYRVFHADLLEHQPPGALERPFFLMAAAQAILASDPTGDDPAGMVQAAIGRLNGALEKILATPDMKQGLNGMGLDPWWSTPDQLQGWLVEEVEKWQKVTRAINYQPE